jgi:ABC-type multidrug transport system fused ATPase/permease subunit
MFRSKVDPGETIAIVGHTGSGKTTIISFTESVVARYREAPSV